MLLRYYCTILRRFFTLLLPMCFSHAILCGWCSHHTQTLDTNTSQRLYLPLGFSVNLKRTKEQDYWSVFSVRGPLVQGWKRQCSLHLTWSSATSWISLFSEGRGGWPEPPPADVVYVGILFKWWRKANPRLGNSLQKTTQVNIGASLKTPREKHLNFIARNQRRWKV